jgi:hypothetical protein
LVCGLNISKDIERTDSLRNLCSIDDLPVSGTVGRDADEGKEEAEIDPHFKPLYVYTHKSFTIDYNGNQVISNSYSNIMRYF